MILQGPTRSAAVNGVTPLWNGGTIVFKTSAGTTIVTVTVGVAAFPSATSGVSTALQASFAAATAVATGTVTQYEVFTSGGSPVSVCTGTVTLSGLGGDFIFTDTSFNTSDILQITGITYTQPAS
jgi:hypothetical protein